MSQIGFVLYLGHGGKPCPSGGYIAEHVVDDEEGQWEHIEDHGQPPHLVKPTDRSCLTVVNTNGVHFCDIRYCSCEGSADPHIQLFVGGLFPATIKEPRTVFTIQVLNDFIRDNVKCGTTAMNYYSKLHRVTSNAFPHLVPVRYLHADKNHTKYKTDEIQRTLTIIKGVATAETIEVGRVSCGCR